MMWLLTFADIGLLIVLFGALIIAGINGNRNAGIYDDRGV